jgi:AcrR family transcriptional regulator
MSPRTGRRAGDQRTAEAILAAARRSFGQHGYTGATIRAVAAEAGVDPALVLHYYRSKADLFVASVRMPVSATETIETVTAAEPAALGEAILRAILGLWDDPETLDAWLGLVRSAVADDRAATMLREFLSAAILGPVAERLGTDDAAHRVSLVASQLVGLGIARHALRIEPLASASADDVVTAVAPTLQRYLTGDLGDAPRRHEKTRRPARVAREA